MMAAAGCIDMYPTGGGSSAGGSSNKKQKTK